MKIVSQTNDLVIPFDGLRLHVRDSYSVEVIALLPDKRGEVIAQYDTYYRAKAVLQEILDNESTGERNVYYMPVE